MEDTAAAVIVTDVALVLCQLTVTLCPELTDAGLTESVTVGRGAFETPVAHPLIPAKTADNVPKATQQKSVFLIPCVFLFPEFVFCRAYSRAEFQMRHRGPLLPSFVGLSPRYTYAET